MYVLLCFLRKLVTSVPYELVVQLLLCVPITLATFNIHAFDTFLNLFARIKLVFYFLIAWSVLSFLTFFGSNLFSDFGLFLKACIPVFFIVNFFSNILKIHRSKYNHVTPKYGLEAWNEYLKSRSENKFPLEVKYNTFIALLLNFIILSTSSMMTYMAFSIVPDSLYSTTRFFIPPKWYYLLTALVGMHNILCVATWKSVCLKWNKTVRVGTGLFNNNGQLREYYYEYNILLRPASEASSRMDVCGICHEDKPNVHFCNNHCFHLDCLVKYINSKGEHFLNESELVSDNTIKLKLSNFPTCPNCKRFTSYASGCAFFLADHAQKKMIKLNLKFVVENS